MTDIYVSIRLTPDLRARMSDAADWWSDSDDVRLGGYLPDANEPNPTFDLLVDGKSHDNWISWVEMEAWLREAMLSPQGV